MTDLRSLWRSTARIAAAAAFGVVMAASLPSAAQTAPQAIERPSYYPADYDKIVEASKNEGGLLVYSIMAEYNWRPVIEDFNKLYPWIKVSTLDLNSNEVFT